MEKGKKIYLMSGAGNSFVMVDGRALAEEDLAALRFPERIRTLCLENGTDGLIILLPGGFAEGKAASSGSVPPDFRMEFFNPDGSGGMMCGNGGRCIAAFADFLGIRPASADCYFFLAPDGPHGAEILKRPSAAGSAWTVRLGMKDVRGIHPVPGGWFLDTGTRHFVRFVDDVEAVDIEKDGPGYRWRPDFAPEGTNVNFVQSCPDGLHVRTFEKGVEGETLACGTGITAAAIAAYHAGIGGEDVGDGRILYRIHARRDSLSVDFLRGPSPGIFLDIHLTGPAVFL